jgi:hypothetical protein
MDTVSGNTVRGPKSPSGAKGPKLQGELTGLLNDLGYQASQVYKF